MKRGVPYHFKTLRLMGLLGCSRAEAVGLLDMLWWVTGTQTPQGNIGRFSDAELGIALGTDRPGATVVAALVEAGWVDRHPEHRLLVHDWAEHADQTVCKLMQRNHLSFLGNGPENPPPTRRRRDTVQTLSGCGRDTVRTKSVPPTPTPTPTPTPEDLLRAPVVLRSCTDLPAIVRSPAPKSLARLARATTWPDGFTLTPELAGFAEAGGLPSRLEFAHFRDHHQAKGSKFVRWDLAFKTWCRRSDQFRRHA